MKIHRPHIRQIVTDWVYLRVEKLWGNNDPLFPTNQVALGSEHRFEAAGLKREHWSTASPIRSIFRDAFTNADLPYFNPHSFRNTLVRLGQTVCQTPEDFKAWSQNLGHEGVLTTFLSYGNVPSIRQGEIIKRLLSSQRRTQTSAQEIAKAVAHELKASNIEM